MTTIIEKKEVEKTLIDRKELCTRWGCSISTLKRREAEGFLKPLPLPGRVVKFRVCDIEAIEVGENL